MASWSIKYGWLLLLPFLTFSLNGCGSDESVATVYIQPTSATVGVNQAKLFTAIARDSIGLIVPATPTWSVSGDLGTISSTGLFIAGNNAGSGTVTATANGQSASANVTVTENGWITGRLSSTLGFASGIKVYLAELPALVNYSDSQGYYELAGMPAGTYNVMTAATTIYQAASLEVSVVRGETRSGVNIPLQAQPGVPEVPTTTLPAF